MNRKRKRESKGKQQSVSNMLNQLNWEELAVRRNKSRLISDKKFLVSLQTISVTYKLNNIYTYSSNPDHVCPEELAERFSFFSD